MAEFGQRKSSTASPRTATLSLEDPDAGGLVLCMCDSTQVSRREVAPVLHAAGYDVDLIETNPRKPLEVGTKSYRLVLFDITPENDNGYQVCAQLRSVSDLPIVLLLRAPARTDILRGYQAGADAYVLVPFDARELLVRMRALLRRRPVAKAEG